MIVGGTIFPHRNIHKETWNSPDGETKNQIDHVLVQQKFRRSLYDVRSWRNADCDSDHNLVIARVKIRLKVNRGSRNERKMRFDTERLKENDIKEEYQLELRNRFSVLAEERGEAEDVNQRWRDIEQAVKDVAEETIGYIEGTRRQHWFDDECRRAAHERKQARINHLQHVNDLGKKEIFRQKRRTAVRIN